MSPSPHPDREPDDQPTIAEIAALTRRLRELSTPGRHVDQNERAVFLADKEALLARITDAYRSPVDGEQGRQLHQHRAQLDRASADPFDGHTDLDDAAWPDDSQGWHPGGSPRLDLPHPDVLPPQEGAVVSELDELAARINALRQEFVIGEHFSDAYDGDELTDTAADEGWSR